MEPLKSVAVFGLGALGLAVIQAAKKAGASDIVGVDINESKFEAAKAMGADHFVNPMKGANSGKDDLLARHKWGYDYTFDCTGNVNVMRSALEVQCTTYVYLYWGHSQNMWTARGKEVCQKSILLYNSYKVKWSTKGSKKSKSWYPYVDGSCLCT